MHMYARVCTCMRVYISVSQRDCAVLSENLGDWPTDLCKKTQQLMAERHMLLEDSSGDTLVSDFCKTYVHVPSR